MLLFFSAISQIEFSIYYRTHHNNISDSTVCVSKKPDHYEYDILA